MMMTLHVNSAVPAAKTLTSAAAALNSGSGGSSHHRGPDAAGFSSHSNYRLGAGGGRAMVTQSHHFRRKYPVIEPLRKTRDAKSLMTFKRPPNLSKDDKVELENKEPEDMCGKHFLFDNKCARLERTRTVVPPLPRDYHVHRPGINRHLFGLPKDLSHRNPGQPFTLGFPQGYELNPGPTILVPSTLFLNGRNTLMVGNCKLSRPKVNYPSYTLMTVKDNHKSQSYPDPVVGAPRSFVHRISELSSLEAETVREERLKRRRQSRKAPS